MNDRPRLAEYLTSTRLSPERIISTDDHCVVLDLSTGSRLQGQAVKDLDVAQLQRCIRDCMRDAGTNFAFGRFGEPRELYNNDNFVDEKVGEARTIHLGIDVFCTAGTPVFAPLHATVEIVTNNDRELDYGPLVILRHAIDNERPFFTLYGHLSLDTLQRIEPGQKVVAGQRIASVGTPPTNGNWPPHLHMQLIDDLMQLGADYPGVAPRSQMDYWMRNSPSPAMFFPECSAELLEYA